MDLLDFDGGELYFDEPIDARAEAAIRDAAAHYGQPAAERDLLMAYFIEPAHPVVQVALYRFFYYQQRYDDALRVAERVISQFAARLGLPDDWRRLDRDGLAAAAAAPMPVLRFYLLALKGAGYLELRLGRHDAAFARLQKVVDLDGQDRLGAAALLRVAREALTDDQAHRAAPA